MLEPAIDVTVTYNGSPESGADVYAYPKTPDCSTTRIPLGTTDSTGKIPANTYAGPGLPFGTYDICAELTKRVSWNWKTWRTTWTGIANTNVNGTSRSTNFQSSNNSTGGCPSS